MRLQIAASVVVLLVLAAQPTFGQARQGAAPRPYPGLFGAPPPAGGESASLSAVLGGGYDTNVLISGATAGQIGQTSGALRGASTTGFASARLTYNRSLGGVQLNVRGISSTNYYPRLGTDVSFQQTVDLRAVVPVSARTRVNLTQRLAFRPYYSFAGLGAPDNPVPDSATPAPDSAPSPDQGGEAQLSSRLTSNTSVGVQRDITRRLVGSATYGYYRSGNQSATAQGAGNQSTTAQGLSNQRAGTRLTYQFTRGLGAFVGYGYTNGRYRDASGDIDDHSVLFGLTFDRSAGLALGRNTRLTFGGGVAAVRDVDRTRYRLKGNVRLTRALARSWTASIAYSRDLQYLDILQAPVFGDTFNSVLSGLVHRRVQLRVSGGASNGRVGPVLQGANRLITYRAAAGLTMAVTSSVGVSADYNYFNYSADDDVTLPTGLAQTTTRQSVRFSLTVSPLFSWIRR